MNDDQNKNLNQTPPSVPDPIIPSPSGNPQVDNPPLPTPPIMITEEETPPPPPPPTSPLPGEPTSPPTTQDEPPSVPSFPPEPDIDTPAPESGLPPVITPPENKPKTGMIAGIAAVLLLLVSIPLGIVLVGQTQELREKAAEGIASGADGQGGCCTQGAEGLEGCAPWEECTIANGACQSNFSCTPKTCTTDSTCGSGNYCSGGQCKPKIASNEDGRGGCCSNDNECNPGEACGTENGACLSNFSCIARPPTDLPPGSVGTGGTCTKQSECADNLTCKDNICKLNSGIQGCCGLDSQCPSGEACNISNGICESGKSCGALPQTYPTPPVGGAPVPVPIAGRCQALKAYDVSWSEIDPNNLKDGDIVRFTVLGSGATFDKGRIRVHDGTSWSSWRETVSKKPGTDEFYIEYTIRADKTRRFEVQAELHHQSANQWF